VTDYLALRAPDLTQPDAVAAFDELPLWCAMAGLFLLEHLPLSRGARVLDVGCGTGFPLLELAQRLGRPATVHGLDRWARALERARFKAGVTGVANVTLTRGDAAAMPFPDGRFDLVVSNLGINNFAEPDAVFRESRRVLRRGGRLALTTNVEGHMAELYAVYEAVLRGHGPPEALEALRRHVAHRGTAASIAARLGRAGFRLTRAVERDFPMRFADGSALLRHYFIRLGFLDGWRGVVTPETEREVFASLEDGLNRRAAERGELALTVPLAYVEAVAVEPA
jgi:arsenite methyltransferase